jgi:tetratricopeptide (TPR) repeat protein
MKRWFSFAGLVFTSLAASTALHAQQPSTQPAKSSPASDDAMKPFEAALRTNPHNADARAGEVKAAIAAALEAKRAGDNDGAMVYLVRGRKFVPDDPELLFDFGVQADGMRLYKDAEEALNQALTLRPGDAEIIYALGHVELDEQKMPQGEAHLREYLQLKPEDASAHYGLGKLLHMEARDEEARAELQRSIALQPHQTESYYELGSLELDLQHNGQAAALFQKVLERNPKHGGALAGMGLIAYREKDYAQGQAWLKAAVMNAPEYSVAHLYYSMVLARLGKKEEAEKEIALAKSLAEKERQQQPGYVLSEPQTPLH